MPTSVPPDTQGTSTRPYLVRALHDWCTDNGFTPYVAVHVDAGVRVPMEYVKNGEIVLNVGFEATSGLRIGNDVIEFKARFGGTSRDIVVPIDHVIAIYARENGQGMAFPAPSDPVPDAEQGARPPASEPVAGSNVSSLPTSVPSPGLRLAPEPVVSEATDDAAPDDDAPTPPAGPAAGGRPSLKRVK
ncbi:stringent starvation protein B [Sphaerotilus hippei]|uniref:Stringent starvation protein B n=1 Tax=Sphaerotilus hippei TaxID=744406 RepID=A0A318H237_9BURK|nr:ClpXP protease specificity-enhancing factor [Sphaerotilus hippei]PXW96669.1 stringent starvation protein B [Sphaerotilus hippei]